MRPTGGGRGRLSCPQGASAGPGRQWRPLGLVSRDPSARPSRDSRESLRLALRGPFSSFLTGSDLPSVTMFLLLCLEPTVWTPRQSCFCPWRHSTLLFFSCGLWRPLEQGLSARGLCHPSRLCHPLRLYHLPVSLLSVLSRPAVSTWFIFPLRLALLYLDCVSPFLSLFCSCGPSVPSGHMHHGVWGLSGELFHPWALITQGRAGDSLGQWAGGRSRPCSVCQDEWKRKTPRRHWAGFAEEGRKGPRPPTAH